MQIISLGEVLWDIFAEQELLGGAPLNLAVSLRKLGHSVAMVTGVGTDLRGGRTILRMNELGISSELVQLTSERATGTAVVTLDSGGHATFVIPRPAAFDCLSADESLLRSLESLDADWLYFGTLALTDNSNLKLLEKLLSRMNQTQGFYDMNLRDGHWTLALVQQLSHLATVLKLNDAEAEILFRLVYPGDHFSIEEFCRRWSAQHALNIVCVTLGSQGCAVFSAGTLHLYPGYKVRVTDTVGAGDAFAAGFLHSLSLPWTLSDRAAFANALGALVASRAGATPDWTIAECYQLMKESRAAEPSTQAS